MSIFWWNIVRVGWGIDGNVCDTLPAPSWHTHQPEKPVQSNHLLKDPSVLLDLVLLRQDLPSTQAPPVMELLRDEPQQLVHRSDSFLH